MFHNECSFLQCGQNILAVPYITQHVIAQIFSPAHGCVTLKSSCHHPYFFCFSACFVHDSVIWLGKSIKDIADYLIVLATASCSLAIVKFVQSTGTIVILYAVCVVMRGDVCLGTGETTSHIPYARKYIYCIRKKR